MTPILSVEIGSRRIRAVLLGKEGGTLWIIKAADAVLPPSEDPAIASVKFLRDFVKQNRVGTRKVFLTVSDPDMVIVKNAFLPFMPAKEIAAATGWVAREEGVAREGHDFFNYSVVKEYEGDDTARKIVVLYTVVDLEKLKGYLDALKRAGYEVAQVGAAPFDYAKVLSCYGSGPASQAVLDMGHDHTLLAVYQNGKTIFCRSIAFSLTKVKAALNDPLFLGALHGTAEADPEIDKALSAYAIPADNAVSETRDNRSSQFFALVRPQLETLVREVRYSLLYFMTHYREDKPATVFLAGHGAAIKGLEALLEKELGVKAHTLTLPSKIRSRLADEDEGEGSSGQYLGAVAGVFASSETVDFMPLDFKNLKMESLQRRALLFATVLLTGLLATAIFFTNMQTFFLKERLTIADRHLKMLGRAGEMAGEVYPRVYLASEIDRATIPPDRLLRLVAHLLPEDVTVKRFFLDVSRRRLELDVTVLQSELERGSAVRDLTARLKETGFFSAVRTAVRDDTYGIEGDFRHD